MVDGTILICYDGCPGSDRGIEAAAELFGRRHAVVVDIAPVLTPAESVISLTSAPVGAFDGLNLDSAREHLDLSIRPVIPWQCGGSSDRHIVVKTDVNVSSLLPTLRRPC